MNIPSIRHQGNATWIGLIEDGCASRMVPLASMVRDNATDSEVMEAIIAVCDEPGITRFVGGGAAPLVGFQLYRGAR